MKAVVSGGTKGIGKTIVDFLAKEGYSVAFGARNIKNLEEFKKSLEQKYPNQEFIAIQCDFSKKEEISVFSNIINSKWTQVNVLVNNVGGYVQDTVLYSDKNRLQEILDINLMSYYYLIKGIQNLIKDGSHVFNILSNLSVNIRENAAAYTIAKHAQFGLHKVIKDEYRKKNIKVTAILPGSVSSASWDKVPNAPREKFIQPEDIAELIICNLKLSKNCLVEEIIVNPMDKNWA